MSRALHAGGTVFVDLHELVFADPSLMVDLAMVARRLRQAGGHLRLRGAQPQIQRRNRGSRISTTGSEDSSDGDPVVEDES